MKTLGTLFLSFTILLCGCTEDFPPPHLVDIPDYTSDFVLYEAASKKDIKTISVDLGLTKIAPVRGLEQLSYVSIPISNNIEFGHSIFHSDEDLSKFESEIQKTLKSSKLGIYAGNSKSSKEMNFYIYTSDIEAWKREIEQLKEKFPESGISEISEADKSWSQFYDYLNPNENQKWLIYNFKQKKELEEDGIALDVTYMVVHNFYFRSEYNRKRMSNDLRSLGFVVENTEGDTGNKKHPYYLELSQQTIVNTDKFDRTVLDIFELSKRRYSLYQGWRIKLVDH